MISLLLASMFGTAQAVPMQLSQQGRLVDSSGVAAAGNHNLTFRLYNASTGGTLLWNETVSTNFTNGYYSVVLGSDTINNPLQDSVLESGDLYVEIEIDSDGPLTPRSAVTSAPFARVAGKAQVADSMDWSGLTSVPSGLDDADTRLAALEALMTTVQADLATANTTISTLESDLSTTQSDLATAQSDLATTQSDLAAAQGDLATANTTIASLQASVGTNTTDIASNASDITGLDTDLTAAEGNITSLQASVTTNTTDIAALQTDVSGISDNVLDMISVDTTWNIGSNGDYSTLEDAMAAARSVRVHPDATLTLQLENNIYTVSDEINLNHPDGANIVIQGNSADPALVQLEFAGTNGFYIDSGHVFGGLNDLTIRGDTTGYVGINVLENATVYASDIDVESFDYGISATWGGTVLLDGDANIQSNALSGIGLDYGAKLRSSGILTASLNTHGLNMNHGSISSTDNSIFDQNTGTGLVANHSCTVKSLNSSFSSNSNYGAVIAWGAAADIRYSDFSDNSYTGLRVDLNAQVVADESTANNNGWDGFATQKSGLLAASACTANSNGGIGFLGWRNSYIEVRNSTAIGNTRQGIKIPDVSYLYEDNNVLSGNGWGDTSYSSTAFIE